MTILTKEKFKTPKEKKTLDSLVEDILKNIKIKQFELKKPINDFVEKIITKINDYKKQYKLTNKEIFYIKTELYQKIISEYQLNVLAKRVKEKIEKKYNLRIY